MKAVKDIKHIAGRTAFIYADGMEWVKCRNCGIRYKVSDDNVTEMMQSHYPYCRGAGRSRWYPDWGKRG